MSNFALREDPIGYEVAMGIVLAAKSDFFVEDGATAARMRTVFKNRQLRNLYARFGVAFDERGKFYRNPRIFELADKLLRPGERGWLGRYMKMFPPRSVYGRFFADIGGMARELRLTGVLCGDPVLTFPVILAALDNGRLRLSDLGVRSRRRLGEIALKLFVSYHGPLADKNIRGNSKFLETFRYPTADSIFSFLNH